MKRSLFSIIFVAFLLPVGAVSQRSQESIDTAAVSRIEDEGMNRSRAMELMSYLTDIYGPRLTGSPQYAEAAEWARKTLSEWGVQNVMIESWGPFGRGWSLKHFSALMTEPRMAPLIAYPKAWSPGLKGTVRSDVVYLDVKSDADLQKFSGKLKGKFVLISEPPQVTPHFEPEARRTTDEMLLKLANADVSAGRRRRGNFGGDSAAVRKFMEQMKLASAKLEFCQREKAAAVLSADRGDGGVVVVQSASVPVYFNNDNGTGKLRGIYLQGNEAARTIFRAWLAPFAHMGASTISLANTGGTDHLSFDGVGLPGFQFIQDPVEYGRTYHSNMDVYERVQEDDLKQASTVMAAFAYDAAMREARFPRKPMPAPRPSSPAGNGN